MNQTEQLPISELMRRTIDKFRGMEIFGVEELAQFLMAERAQFSTHELTAFGQLFATRFGHYGDFTYVPDWLADIFSAFVEGASPSAVCDPWAGAGFLIGVLCQRYKPKSAIALSRSQSNVALGKILVPTAKWICDESIQWLLTQNTDFDVVASVLPINVKSDKSITVPSVSGEFVEFTDDLGNLILVTASMRLRPSGIGLFVVPTSFFISSRSVFHRLADAGLGVEAALAIPPGTFGPSTPIATYLVVVRRKPTTRMFVGQLCTDTNVNRQILENFIQETEGGSLDLGRFVVAGTFRGIEALRSADALILAENRFGARSVNLADLSDIKTSFRLGRPGDTFEFESLDNAIYLPLIGNSEVVESPDQLKLKPYNYAQVVIDPSRSNARFIARFLNSELGKQFREQSKSGFIPRLNKQTIKSLPIFVPDLATQQKMLAVEAKITAEQTTVIALQNELAELNRELWSNPTKAPGVEQRISELSDRLSGGIKQHLAATLEQWFETLPFPLASILRAWQATPTQDFKTKYEHLIHFFEATAEFLSVIFLSAYSSNLVLFAPYKEKLRGTMQKQNLSFERATFGTWKLVVEYLGKQTRILLDDKESRSGEAGDRRKLCAEMFSDPSLSLPLALCRTEIATILSTTNKMRNDWSGHGGVVGIDDAKSRNQQLLGEVEKLREAFSDIWMETQLVYANHCRPRNGLFENEVSILTGSNSEFLKQVRSMTSWLDVDRLYLSNRTTRRAMFLLPLVAVGPSPQSTKNACYFFNRMEKNGARFVSYHFADKPEHTGDFKDVSDTIRMLSND